MFPMWVVAGPARGRWGILAAALAGGLLAGCAVDDGADAPSPRPVVAVVPPLTGGVDPERLIGLDAAALQQMFGTPHLVRREAPAEIWQYQAHSCVLDLYLYEESDGMRVRYLEALTGTAQATAPRPCVDALRSTHDKLLSS